jgi:polyisoprenoid-binding protein YceI
MRLTSALAFATALTFATPAFADRYEFDKEHTHINFTINHLGFSEMLGLFTSYDGKFEFDEQNPEKSKVTITLKPDGIRTSSEKLDEHLRGKDFFDTAKFPYIRFVSTSVKVTGERTGDITGDLTMMGVTKPVVVHATFNKGDYHPMSNMYIAGFTGSATLKRSDFGMNYGIPMVGDEVRLEFSTEGVNQDRKKAEAVKKK